MPHKKEKTAPYLVAVKIAVFLLILLFIYEKVSANPGDFSNLRKLIAMRLRPWQFLCLLFLMPVNWGLEIAKWHYLVSRVYPVSWWVSIRGVMSGLALGFITPHAIGDYFGRISELHSHKGGRFIGLVMLSRVSQMAITGFFGLWGLYIIYSLQDVVIVAVTLFLLAACSVLLLKYITSDKRQHMISSVGQFFVSLRVLKPRDYLIVSVLAFLRYLIFWFQMAWSISLIAYTDFELALSGSTWIFLSKSVLPAFNFLSDLGVREASAIYFFEKFSVAPVPVMAATLLVWCINILLPTLAGAVVLMKLRSK